MNEALADLIRHNAWATRALLDFCADLSEEQLGTRAPGAFGTLLETLHHFVTSEGGYRFFLTGQYPDWADWRPDETPDFSVVRRRAVDMARFWESFLEQPYDPDELVTSPRQDGSMRVFPKGVVLAQVINHGNEHRGQACTIITALGLQPPEIDGWSYGYSSGRSRVEEADPPPAS